MPLPPGGSIQESAKANYGSRCSPAKWARWRISGILDVLWIDRHCGHGHSWIDMCLF